MSPEYSAPYNDTLPIEKYALLTENAPGLQERLHHWFGFYRPSTPVECELLGFMIMSSVLNRRTFEALTETVNQGIRMAQFRYDCEQEDEVMRLQELLETQPGKAIKGLERTALGCRFLISRYERLFVLLNREDTLYGNDRDELIRFQGARPELEHVIKSEGAYLTRFYCLTIRDNVDKQDYYDLHASKCMPQALKDRDSLDWLGSPYCCHTYLKTLVERALAELRPREARLRSQHEDPARAGAEVRKQVLVGPDGRDYLNQSRTHQVNFTRACALFNKGRKESARSGLPPGAPVPGVESTPIVTKRPDPAVVAQAESELAAGRIARTQNAAELAPKSPGPIGLRTFGADAAFPLVQWDKEMRAPGG